MHWEAKNVNPMLALRNAVWNDRWDETWVLVEHELRRQMVLERRSRRKKRAVATRCAGGMPLAPPAPASAPVTVMPTEVAPKPPHPWKRAWSVHRQCERANAS